MYFDTDSVYFEKELEGNYMKNNLNKELGGWKNELDEKKKNINAPFYLTIYAPKVYTYYRKYQNLGEDVVKEEYNATMKGFGRNTV